MTSVAWEFCMALDLFSLVSIEISTIIVLLISRIIIQLNDPFTSPRKNRTKYQFIAHSLGILSAAIMLSDASFYGESVGHFCWVKCSGLSDGNFVVFDIGIWIFIAVPVTFFISTNIYVTAISYQRFVNEYFLHFSEYL